MDLSYLSELSYKQQEEELNKKIWSIKVTETSLRKWKRRLLVALTDEESNRCKYHIKLYGGE